MNLIPYKSYKIVTKLTKDEFFKNLNEQTKFSKSKGFFNTASDDYTIEAEIKNNEIKIIEKNGGRSLLPTEIILNIKDQTSITLFIKIIPQISGIILFILLNLFAWMIPFPVLVKLIFSFVNYILIMIGFKFDVWWTEDLISKKLLRKEQSPK